MPPPWKMLNELGATNDDNGHKKETIINNKSEAKSPDSPNSTSFMKSLKAKSSRMNTNMGNNEVVQQKSNQVKVMFWPSAITEHDLESLFSTVGKVTRAKILAPRDGRDITICFVTFSAVSEAENAVEKLNNYEIDGRRIKVEMDDKENMMKQGCHIASKESSSNQIKIVFWPASLNEEDLKILFSNAGDIERLNVLPAREGRDSTLAFVTFKCQESSQNAISSYNGHEIKGKRLRVEMNFRDSFPSSAHQQEKNDTSTASGGCQVKILSCPSSLSEGELKNVFCTAGSVEQLKILPARPGRDITLAFVTFCSEVDAVAAVTKFDGFELMGKKLRVSLSNQNGIPCKNSKQNSETFTKPWSSNGSKISKPWQNVNAQSSDKVLSSIPTNSRFNGSSMEDVSPAENSSEGEENDGGIFINEDENHHNFSSKPAPVIYIPPPPPEGESEIFKNTSHQGINFQNYENIPIEVTGRDPPTKIDSFHEAELHQICTDNVKRSKYAIPTPIQKHVIPVVCSGRDVMACAQTGSGKTAAYLLPIISNLLTRGIEADIGETAFPSALIIAPTRELAVQIFLESRKFSFGSHLRTVVIYGGVSVSHQLGKLYDGCDILVATPGRLNDFLKRSRISLSAIKYLVLDEADRMLDMGFGPVIKSIVESGSMVPKHERQTLMLSATFPESIQVLAGSYLNDYIFITVGLVGGASSDIMQTVLEIPSSEKRAKLEEILLESGDDRILVFVETKRSADFLASFLSQRSFPTTSISSDRSQEERESALKDFRLGKAPVLIATAVAARGLDIPDVKKVINFDLPSEIDEYIHRIGRTGRIGNQGSAVAFFDRLKDQKIARGLIKVLSKSGQEVPEWLEEIAMGAVGSSYGPGGGQFLSRDRRNNKAEPGNHHGMEQSFQKTIPSESKSSDRLSKDNFADDSGDMWC